MNEDTPRPDYVSEDEPEEKHSLEDNVKSKSTWLRLFYMIVVFLLYGVSRVVAGAVILLQFFWVLFTGETNKGLLQLGASLATYTYQIMRFLTFNTEEKPFPFDQEWPSEAPDLRTE